MTTTNKKCNIKPTGWTITEVSKEIEKISTTHKKVKQKDYLSEGTYPVIDQGLDYIGGYTTDDDKVLDCELPVIVFGDHTKIIKLINFKFAPGADGVKVIIPSQAFDPILFSFFLSIVVQKIPDKGYARHFQHVENSTIPIPPLPEQHRIVSKIEELFSDLDNGIEQLKTAQQQLAVYRQAVLKWAFEGKLTKVWREENKPESTDKLLKQIQIERKKPYQKQIEEWEQKVQEWEADDKPGRKPAKPRFVNRLTKENLELNINVYPDCWHYVRLGELAEIVGGVTKGRKLDDNQTINLPYLRVANVQDGYLDLDQVKKIDVLPDDLAKYKLKNGDILYTEGGDKDKLGRGTIWKGEIENCIHQNHIFRARVITNLTNPKYVAYFSQTRTAKDYFFDNAKQTVNLASINMTVLSNLPLPLCSYQEQKQIVQEIESRLSEIEHLENTIFKSLNQSEALRQSILKKAFEGKLVPQDPNDEPASELLKGIKAEKKSKTPKKTKSKKAS